MGIVGACRCSAIQWCRALPASVVGMQLTMIIAPSIHFCKPLGQRQVSTCSGDMRQVPQQTRWVHRHPHAIPSAARQAAQMHLNSSSIRTGGLQTHTKDVRASQNGLDAGQSLPSRDSQHDSSNGGPPPIEQPSDTRSRAKPTGAQSSQFNSHSNHPAELQRQPLRSYMPPHLFKAIRKDQQASNGYHEGGSAPAVGPPSQNGTKVAAGELNATLPPAEVTDLGEKAEGVIRMGTRGTPIPLYGRTLQSIQEVTCVLFHLIYCMQAGSISFALSGQAM